MYDIIIIGAGPAGLTAAIYALRAGKKVLVLEKKAYGGQIVNATKVKNYPGFLEISGLELAENMYEQVKAFSGEVKFEEALGVSLEDGYKLVRTDESEYKAKAVILATGAENGKLGASGEEKLAGKGVSYCATCDGSLYKGKNVAVIGGGNTALYDALYLADIASKVYLIHRRDEFRAQKTLVDLAKEKVNIEFVLGAKVAEFLGEDKLTSLKLDDGRVLEVDGAFVAVGYVPQNQAFSDVVSLDEKGYVETSDGTHTNIDGIYVAGDAKAKELKQLVTATSDGAMAATVAIKELEN